MAIEAQAAETLRVGVRQDANPFAYQEDGKFKGFIYEICEKALEFAGFGPGEVTFSPVNATQRVTSLIAESGAEERLDMVCDPMTVTIGRSAELVFSSFVFVSGGSFVYNSRADQKFHEASWKTFEARREAGLKSFSHAGISLANNGVPVTGDDKPARQVDLPLCKDVENDGRLIGAKVSYVQSTTGENLVRRALAADDTIQRTLYQTVCAAPLPTHAAAIDALCADQISYHFGDRDIIDAYLSLFREANPDADCQAETSQRFLSAEPYAIAISPHLDQETALLLQQSILKVFKTGVRESDSDVISATFPFYLFVKYFQGKNMTEYLRILFLINYVPD